MAFPLSIAGTVSITKSECGLATLDQLAVRIEDMLDTALATRVTREANSIIFTASFFRLVLNWNILVYFTSGRIELCEEGETFKAYYLGKMVQTVIVGTLMIASMAAMMIRQDIQRGDFPSWDHAWPIGIGWLWIVGGNYVTAAVRFPRWLERGLRRSAERQT